MRRLLLAIACALAIVSAQQSSAESSQGVVTVESFDAQALPTNLKTKDARARLVADQEDGGHMLEVRFQPSDQPKLTLSPPGDEWDWRGFGGLAIDVRNVGDNPVEVFAYVRGRNEAGERRLARGSLLAPPREKGVLRVFLRNYGLGPYTGMRGIPVMGPVLMMSPGMPDKQEGPVRISELSLHLRRCTTEHILLVGNIRLFEAGSPLDQLVSFPFVDRFGQYIHDDWPGKVHDDSELQLWREKEEEALRGAPEVGGRDRFGGWADGPKLDATGWFRTEKLDGKWWLVTPEGHLFFSLGVNCVHRGDRTYVAGRDRWFEPLPQPDQFSGLIDGTTANFYSINLKRKFGDQYERASRETAYRRLKAWGFNTIANWSAADIVRESPMPFVVRASTGGGRVLEASAGYWGKLLDPFDPAFVERVRENVQGAAAPFAEDPRVLGYFVDGEPSWTRIAYSTLASPPDQPARQVFIEDLKVKYGTIDRLNDAWGTTAADWDELRIPLGGNRLCLADSEAFEYKFARRYFDTVKDALRTYAPHHLYLGCRFAPIYCPEPVLRACADVADVVSIDAYYSTIPPNMWQEIDRPAIVGEFHFGALDRGMFHQGLQAAADQHERAAMYVDYVKSVADHPLFVGCHWFQYVDQPLTGRTGDGENYSIGLVSVVDVPYRELVDAARQVHRDIYTYRSASPIRPEYVHDSLQK
jgi:hypothetical protein